MTPSPDLSSCQHDVRSLTYYVRTSLGTKLLVPRRASFVFGVHLQGEIAAVHSRLFPGQGVVTCTALRTDDNRESTQPGYFIWDQYDATGELSASPLPAARRQASCLTWRCRFLESGLDTDFTATLSLCMLRALHRSPSLPVCGYGNSGDRPGGNPWSSGTRQNCEELCYRARVIWQLWSLSMLPAQGTCICQPTPSLWTTLLLLSCCYRITCTQDLFHRGAFPATLLHTIASHFLMCQ